MKHDYNYNNYLNSCLRFAEESKNWGELNNRTIYISKKYGDWEESSDNPEGNLEIAWSFKKDKKYIIDNAYEHFVNNIASIIECLCGEFKEISDEEYPLKNIIDLIDILKKKI